MSRNLQRQGDIKIRVFRMFSILGLLVILCCGTAHAGILGKNVIFSDEQRSVISSGLQADEYAVFYDRNGALYPGDHVKLGTWCRSAKASLEWLIMNCRRDLLPDKDSGGSPEKRWSAFQDNLREQVAAKLREATRGRTLVILIHGFNNDPDRKGTPWYSSMELRSDITDRVPEPIVLKVYWDGLSGNEAGIGIWGEAQYNAKIIGQEFRRLLKLLPEDIPVRILTHSTGAVLIANALGDASSGFGDECAKEGLGKGDPGWDYCQRAAGGITEYALPKFSDLRVAMLIPAASADTFASYGDLHGLSGNHLILGLNPNDFATRKSGFLPCRRFGATCMTTQPADACARTMKAIGGKTRVALFNVGSSDTTRFFGLDKHDALAYHERREKWIPFVNAWLRMQPQPDDSARFCRL